MKVTIICFVLICFICGTRCSRILGIFPMPATSHYNLGSSLMKGLAEAGHEVTMISPFEEKSPPKNGKYTDIVVSSVAEQMEQRHKERNMFDIAGQPPFMMTPAISLMTSQVINSILNDTKVMNLLKSDQAFDAVIVEQFMIEGLNLLAAHYKAPLILLSTLGANDLNNALVGNPSPPSYIPNLFLSYSPQMTFFERLKNVLLALTNILVINLFHYPTQNKIVHKFLPEVPHLDHVLYNVSLILLNSHISINQAIPHVPNMVEIGGFHVKPPKKLPQDLQEFLDGAKEGVIYFSMGSNLKSKNLPVEKRDALLKAFSKLKEKVLWKWEDEVLPGQPKNVKMSKWFPQQDILAHPNVKLFITHGGMLSTTETIYNGVPILAIPIFGDQGFNAKLAANNGFGLIVKYSELTEENLTKNLRKLLDNPSYKINAQTRSQLFHDRLVKPMDEAVFWVEYVIRHGGAAHLRVAALDLPWYKYHLLDVIGFLAVSTGAFLYIVYIIFWKIIFKKICSWTQSYRKSDTKLKRN